MISIQEKRAREHRDTSRDGPKNRIEAYILTHFAGLWNLIMAIAHEKKVADL